MKSLFLLSFVVLGLYCEDPNTNGISENLPVKEGGDVVLHCDLGTPTERCIWRKNNRIVRLLPFKYELIGDISRGDCSIRIKNANRRNAGHYECFSVEEDDELPRKRRESQRSPFGRGIIIDVLCKYFGIFDCLGLAKPWCLQQRERNRDRPIYFSYKLLPNLQLKVSMVTMMFIMPIFCIFFSQQRFILK